MPKLDAAAELAAKLVQTLEQQRQDHSDAYPLTVARLAALADPQATPELTSKALGKKPHAARLLRAGKKSPDSPIALAEDADRLAGSPLTLAFALAQLCSAEKPLHPLARVIGKVDKALQPAFKAALEKQVADGTLPPEAGSTRIKEKIHLFLKKYPPPLTPAGELARKLVQVLQERRAQGGDAYPVSLDELKKAVDETVKPAQFRQALAQEDFTRQVIRPVASRTDAPVVLAADRDLLAGSRALLEYLLLGTTTKKQPLATVSHLKHHLILELQQPFEETVARQVAGRSLPPTVGVVPGDVPELYLIAEVSAAWVLGQKLLRTLKARRDSGQPASLGQLLQLADANASPELVRKALADKAVKPQLVVAIAGDPESPVVGADDRDQLAASPALLEHLLAGARTADSQAVPLPDLAKKLDKTLRYTFETTLEQQMETKALPPGLGTLRIKKVPYLFFLNELQRGSVSAPQPQPAPTPDKAAPAAPPFGPQFDEAFDRLNRLRGGHNLVSLVELRRALAVQREVFDSELNRLRREGRYTLSAAEGREGITSEEREAGLLEHGTLLLYVSRRSLPENQSRQ